jgi:oligopeptide/dipeptide ABC transporter ATP-binding protein
MRTPGDIELERVRVRFPASAAGGWGLRRRMVTVLHAIDLTLRPGEVFSFIGESGSGKSTLLNALLGFAPIGPGGRISYAGRPLSPNRHGRVHGLRPLAQLVFQDPGEALNPHWSVARAIDEALLASGMEKRQRRHRVRQLAAQMELAPDLLHHRPRQLSGGQRQRVCIARALATSPPWLFMDEPLSSLDPPIRRSITTLLGEIAAGGQTTLVMVTHQLELVRRLGGRVAVLYLGRIMESGPVVKVFAQPRHPYTRALLSSVLTPGFWTRERIVLQGEAPSPTEVPPGCVFHPRCPQAMDHCRRQAPPPVAAHGPHRAACHLEAVTS